MLHKIDKAHQTIQNQRPAPTMIWGLAWHPEGHMLASTGNDWRVRFWGKHKPYEHMNGPPNLATDYSMYN